MKINKHKNQKNKGFTLVEISIVIIIISLLVAGVVAGQKLLQNAKLQTVIKEIRENDTAIKQFKDKFRYYPGDLPTAATYWGTYSAGPPITGATSGDGNWMVEWSGKTEDLMFWRHLALAGFLPGNYTGTISGTRYNPGVNTPASALKSGGYEVNNIGGAYGTNGNAMYLGSLFGNWAGHLNGRVINAPDAYYIDTKIDDGLAATGNFYTSRADNDAFTNTCTTAAMSAASATYILTDTKVTCQVFWWLDKNK